MGTVNSSLNHRLHNNVQYSDELVKYIEQECLTFYCKEAYYIAASKFNLQVDKKNNCLFAEYDTLPDSLKTKIEIYIHKIIKRYNNSFLDTSPPSLFPNFPIYYEHTLEYTADGDNYSVPFAFRVNIEHIIVAIVKDILTKKCMSPLFSTKVKNNFLIITDIGE